MRVLVTGGSGFIGSHVVDALVDGGHDVEVFDTKAPSVPNPGASYVPVDLTDGRAVEQCLGSVDAVSHQAAMVGLGVAFDDVAAYVRTNDLGTANLLGALARRSFRGPFVLAGSMVVYGEGGYRCSVHGPLRPLPRSEERLRSGCFEPACPRCGRDVVPLAIKEDAPVDPRNVYAATKLHQEHLAFAFGRELGVPVASLRYHNVYGPRMPRDTPYAGVAAVFGSALRRGAPPQVFEDGRQIRDFVHVRDVARANVLALEAGATGSFNVASGEPHTIGDAAAAMASAFGPNAAVPEVTGRYRRGDVRHVFGSPHHAEEVLGFRAAVPFDEGMLELASSE